MSFGSIANAHVSSGFASYGVLSEGDTRAMSMTLEKNVAMSQSSIILYFLPFRVFLLFR
jgi:hypothetical protein